MKRRQCGFTLLEVMVALAVLALTLGAMIKAGGASARNVALLRDQTLASWVALNKVNETLLQREWPEPGSRADTVTLGNREWYWEVRIGKTSDPELRRVEVAVREQRNTAPLVELIAFKGRTGTDADTGVEQDPPGEGTDKDAGAKAKAPNKAGPSRSTSKP
ncbi:MAG: type II secretion system minor pseudopilin GspI [Candidatus Competibacteraceae bacterium]